MGHHRNIHSMHKVVIIEQNSDNDKSAPFCLITDLEEHILSDNKDLNNDEIDLRDHRRKKDTKEDNDNKKKRLAQKFYRQVCSNIVQHVKDAVHVEFMDLEKPKTKT
ncbi:hypothetical protein C1646_763815 [Rhizophagus diaphanus]|nr:hypothetical protein C1646_763815 [Rhizophagus diaphanus] [Rhizophagus sp. MUCL 43196]